MSTPEDVDVWIGLDLGKEEHFAVVALIERAAEHGTPARTPRGMSSTGT